MASLDDTYRLIEELSGGSSIGLLPDNVMRESAVNILKQQGKEEPSEDEINFVLQTWTKNPDGSDKADVRNYYNTKLCELDGKFRIATGTLGRIPSEMASISSVAASGMAAPAAVPMLLSIKSEVANAKVQLLDCLKLCCEMGIGAPAALTNAISVLANCASLVGL